MEIPPPPCKVMGSPAQLPSPALSGRYGIRIAVSGRQTNFHERILFVLKPKPALSTSSPVQQAKLPHILFAEQQRPRKHQRGETCPWAPLSPAGHLRGTATVAGEHRGDRSGLERLSPGPPWLHILPQEMKCLGQGEMVGVGLRC